MPSGYHGRARRRAAPGSSKASGTRPGRRRRPLAPGAPPDKDEVKIVEIDLQKARDKQITLRNHVFNDRFPDEYVELLDKEGL